jgi:hypothetical protein
VRERERERERERGAQCSPNGACWGYAIHAHLGLLIAG